MCPPHSPTPPLHTRLLTAPHSLRRNPRTGACTLDWRDAEAQRCLTRALLLARYGLDVVLPPDRLCPAVTGRANYIRFLHTLLGRSPSSTARTAGTAEGGPVWGVDIGTGAACIYALLGARLHGWHFVATDTDAASLACARANVARNGLAALVETRLVAGGPAAPLVEPLARERPLDFTVCNPPFFSEPSGTPEEGRPRRTANPRRACTARAHEACTPGGEAAFVCRLVDESARVPLRCRWWSSLLGCKRSLRAVWDYLHGGTAPLPPGLPLAVEEAELVQGRTARWVIAWSFCAPPPRASPPLAKRPRQCAVTSCSSSDGCGGDKSVLLDASPKEQQGQEQEQEQSGL